MSHAYCSPYLQAAEGSTHGYDVVDPHRLNRELGGVGAYQALAVALRGHGLGQVLDIVPNHMALDGRDNRWWWDVLANGPSSPYALYFDIDWDSPERKLTGSVLVPVLGDHYGRVLDAGEITIARDAGGFVVRYFDHTLPLSPRTYDELLARAGFGVQSDELASLATAFGALPHALIVDPDLAAERQRHSRALADRLGYLIAHRPDVGRAIDAALAQLNADPDALDALLQRQNFRLAFWRTASEELDYRRFFNIETLAGIRVEDERVFTDTHCLIVALVEGGTVDGLRVDHVDGLQDPEAYLERLHQATGGVTVVVEKILAPDEALPDTWPVAGTTGYDFLNRVNGLFVAGGKMAELTDGYQAFTGQTDTYDEIVHEAKMQIMREELSAEVERLTALWADVCERHRRHRDYTRRELRAGLREVLAAFGVYRTYVRPGAPVGDADRKHVHQAVADAQARRPDLDPELFAFLGSLLLLEHPGPRETELAVRFQQLSSPVMAKGVEDTAFYRYNRLVSLNEVGGSPDLMEDGLARFHRHCAEMSARWPETMLTLATHDTKRGTDARARINVLSELPGPWRAAIDRWAGHNRQHRCGPAPDPNTEYLIYQTLVGAWPIDAGRLGRYMEKATKEAKVHTSWVDPVPAYDESLQSFAAAIVADPWFVADLEAFLAGNGIVLAGRINSLAQTTLLLTSPGAADLYQGTELWDLSLVDPDNRRPVDYQLRRELLGRLGLGASAGPAEAGPAGAGPAEALGEMESGGVKLWLVHRLLADRRDRPRAYGPSSGYRPLPVEGPRAANVVAFGRTGGLVVIVPRLVSGLGPPDGWGSALGSTTVSLPPGRWVDVLSGATFEGGNGVVSSLLSQFPVAVLAEQGS